MRFQEMTAQRKKSSVGKSTAVRYAKVAHRDEAMAPVRTLWWKAGKVAHSGVRVTESDVRCAGVVALALFLSEKMFVLCM
jgi:hypothetical protein